MEKPIQLQTGDRLEVITGYPLFPPGTILTVSHANGYSLVFPEVFHTEPVEPCIPWMIWDFKPYQIRPT